MPSEAKLDSVRMALDVVMFERLAMSSRERQIFSVLLSSSNPYVSFSTSKASARRPRMCFCVSVTVRRFEKPRSVANARITFMATSELLRTIPKMSSVFMMQTMESSRASADAMCISSAKKAR